MLIWTDLATIKKAFPGVNFLTIATPSGSRHLRTFFHVPFIECGRQRDERGCQLVTVAPAWAILGTATAAFLFIGSTLFSWSD